MNKQIAKIKLRKAVKHFFAGKILSAKHCIESKHGTKWFLLGDATSKGPLKFDTAEERDAYLTDLESKIAIQEKQDKENKMSNKSGQAVIGSILLVVLILILVTVGMVGCPQYNVYQQRMEGEALLAHAQSSKEVAVAEAKAKMESATLLAQAEVSRAEGVAKANKIIGDSLKGNESYLRYLWIMEVANNQQGKTVVYVPTEANLPILEAGRHTTEVK